MNSDLRKSISKVLTTPIECTTRRGENREIKLEGSVIRSTQTYYSGLDPDMSDFSVGFYEVLYKDILPRKNPATLLNGDQFCNKAFAGDTMNSFYTIEQLILDATSGARPEYLEDFFASYHCLANFWLIPMHIGRTSSWTPAENARWAKTSKKYDTQDYVDRFLRLLKSHLPQYRDLYPDYFANKSMDSFEDFVDIHHLIGSYVDEEMGILEYSTNTANPELIVEFMQTSIRARADVISGSSYAEELGRYFNELGLLETKLR
ncbi:MAG: hypothetical protein RSB25_15920 [Acinetobacter sp.]